MKQFPFADSRAGKIALSVFLVAIMFLSRDSLFCNMIFGFERSQFVYAGLFAVMVLAFLYRNRRELRSIVFNPRIVWALILSAILLLPMVVKRDWQLMYFSILICLYVAVFLTYFTDVNSVARIYVLAITVLGAYSVITSYLLRIPADHGVLVPQIIVRPDEISFYNYWFSYVSIWYVKNRNFGIFREPGVYQYFLMLAIYLNNYRVDWNSWKQQWIVNGLLAITMLTTFATGGVIELGLFVVVLYLDKKWYRTRQGRLLGARAVAAVLAAIAFIVIQHGELYEELYRMVEKFFNESDSITDRVGSFTVNLSLFAENPIVGVGLSRTLHAIENNTSSSLILFAVLGFVGGSLNVISWFFLVWDQKHALWANLALTAILAMAFNTQNLITDPWFWIFPIMAMTQRSLPWVCARLEKGKR